MSARNDPHPYADNVGSYLLGALPEDELAAFQSHLEGCARCRDEVVALKVAVDTLPAAAPPALPPRALKARVMSVVESEAQLLRASGAGADRAPSSRRAPRRSLFSLRPLALAGSVALLAIGVLAGALLIGDGGGGAGAPSARTVVARVDPDLAPHGSATLRLTDGAATLSVRNMPSPSGNRVYEVWRQRPGQNPQPTHVLFSVPRDGSTTVTVPGSMKGVDVLMVTAEPPGGSRVPSSPTVISARI